MRTDTTSTPGRSFFGQEPFARPMTRASSWKRARFRSAEANPTSGASDMGTELVKMFTYDFGGGLKADLGATLLFAGDFYKSAPGALQPDTLWQVFSRVQLEF